MVVGWFLFVAFAGDCFAGRTCGAALGRARESLCDAFATEVAPAIGAARCGLATVAAEHRLPIPLRGLGDGYAAAANGRFVGIAL